MNGLNLKSEVFISILHFLKLKEEDGTFNTVMRLWAWHMMNHGLIPSRAKRTISSPKHSDQDWEPPSFHFNGYHGFFPSKYIK